MSKPVCRCHLHEIQSYYAAILLFDSRGSVRSGIMYRTFKTVPWIPELCYEQPSLLMNSHLFSLKIAVQEKSMDVCKTHECSLSSLPVFSFCMWQLPLRLAYLRILFYLSLPSQRKIRHNSKSTKNLWTKNIFYSSFWDQYKILEKHPPTPPLTQHIALTVELVV